MLSTPSIDNNKVYLVQLSRPYLSMAMTVLNCFECFELSTQNNYYKNPRELGTKIVYNIYFVTNKLWLIFFTYQTFCIRWETMEWFQWQNSFRCEVFDVIPSLLEKIAQLDLMAVLISSFLVYRMCAIISYFLYINFETYL